jgi:poly(A) polymerase
LWISDCGLKRQPANSQSAIRNNVSAERQFAIDVVRKLREAGFQALWAGGCVRDQLLGLEPHDYDVATDARPEDVRRLFRRSIAVGASFGVVEVLGPKIDSETLKVQVATFRTEGPYSDGRRPDPEHIAFSSPEEDAQRRDFTINGMFFDPLQDRVIDHVGGQDDLKARLLRAIGDPVTRFLEDKLRLLRAVRIAARFDFTIEPATHAAIGKMAEEITVVSAERITDEFHKMLVDRRRVRAMNLLWQLGLVKPLLPELVPMRGLPQGPPSAPTGDLWDHVMAVLALLEAPSFALALAALLHDVGKPRTIGRTPERYTFYHHEHVGRDMTDAICLRFKLSNADRERVTWLVEKHQYLSDARQMKTSKLKTILAHPGIHELLALHRVDAVGSGRSTDHVDYCEQLLKEWTAEDLHPPRLVTGHDLLRRGLEQGPRFKQILDAVWEAQLEGQVRTPSEAHQLVDQLLAAGGATRPSGQDE